MQDPKTGLPIEVTPEPTENTNPIPPPTPPEVTSPKTETTPPQPASTPTPDYQSVLDQYSTSQPQPESEPQSEPQLESKPQPEIQPKPEAQPQPEPQPPITENPIRSSEEQLQDLGISVPTKSGGGIFKVIFTIALIIFLCVLVILGFVYFKSQSNNQDNPDSSSFDTIKTTPTPDSGSCFLNDKTYQIGESFTAADGCNTCTCDKESIITCTEKVCEPTPSTPVATKSATPSSTKN